jgi:ribosomal protein S12 methylthiotransferase
MRGRLASRRIDEVLREAERLVNAGVKELLVISQDTSAYGADLRYAPGSWRGQEYQTRFVDLAHALGELPAWVRLHYVYPYPHVDAVIALMAEGRVLPYLDIPFQHGSPAVLRRMRRPAHAEDTLARIRAWRRACPQLTLRSTFIVGFPGETEAEFEELLGWLDEAGLDRVGCFKYSPVEGAAANALPGHVAPQIQEERYARFMEKAAAISARRLAARVGTRIRVLVDEVVDGVAVARSAAEAPQIDGVVRIREKDGARLTAGEWADVEITGADAYDLTGSLLISWS